MPRITRIIEQKRQASRRSVYLDGRFAFGCSLNVVAKFRLREGMELSEAQVEAIRRGEVRQECLDQALAYLGQRLHSQAELRRKLMRREYGEDVVSAVMEDLSRLGYVDDERFAKTKALSAARHKQHGRRRAMAELLRSGVAAQVAERALDDVYAQLDGSELALKLAMKQAPRLRRLQPHIARRRLAAMLQRRGFDYDAIKPVIDQVLGDEPRRGDNVQPPAPEP
jgi:regulatory protein